ncbi:Outer membrane protein, OmpA/MotB family [Labilithrix luteola]|uniref:Outer membrane protein, OmpA/MotB family n=1 Tax=Labilithrix luteola TaxID=1391654 RepID=A0A0K1QCA0_9BACT|nr:protein kinase [Labilithrix luteola]AKV03353.1 Outer membrane protein, OmpA/MotB family [Labilithrix luteola]
MMSSMPTSGSPQEIPPVTGLSLRPGDVVGGRFHLTAQLEDGPPCARFAAVQTDTGVPVEVQVFTVDETLAASSRELVDSVRLRFLADARKAASLRSVHTAGVLQVGVTDQGDPFLVTEAIADGTLASLMKERGALPTEHAVDIALAICDSLVEAHAHGLVHGSLDPRCVHLAWSEDGPSRVKVADLATARSLASLPLDLRADQLRQPLVLRAPELLQHGREADARSDIWGLAVMVYTMLAGEPPFGAETPSTVNLSIMLDEQTLLAGVPDLLAETVDSSLSKAPQLRARTMKAFSEELGPFGSRPFVSTPPSLRAIDTGRFEAVELERLKEESAIPELVSVTELGDDDLIEEEITEFDDTIRGSTAIVLRPSPVPPIATVTRVAPPIPAVPAPPAPPPVATAPVPPPAAVEPEKAPSTTAAALPKPPSAPTRAALPAPPSASMRAPLPPPPSTTTRAALPAPPTATPAPTPTPGQTTTEPLSVRRSTAPVAVSVAPPPPPVRPPPRLSVPLAKTLEPPPAKKFSASTLAMAAAFLAVGVGIGTYTSRTKAPAAASEAPAVTAAETVAAPTSAPIESVNTPAQSTAQAEAAPRIPLAPASMGVAQLPEAPATATASARPVPVAAKPRTYAPAAAPKPAAPAAAPKADSTDSLVRSAAAPIQPEPKASNDDLHKFLDDRR